jgi:hypothetical protein
MTRTASLALVVLVLGGCRGRERPAVTAEPDSATVAAARTAAGSLGADLLGMLTTALQEGGPAHAIAFCADSAQARTARHAAAGIYIRRVGTRVRNPANAPDSAERAVLAAFAAAQAAGIQPADTFFVVASSDGPAQLHYLRPVRIGEPCLTCHGDPATIADTVRAVLAARYPGDEATGYRLGNLRGAVSVRIPIPQ